jgi:hypothetical protein
MVAAVFKILQVDGTPYVACGYVMYVIDWQQRR